MLPLLLPSPSPASSSSWSLLHPSLLLTTTTTSTTRRRRRRSSRIHTHSFSREFSSTSHLQVTCFLPLLHSSPSPSPSSSSLFFCRRHASSSVQPCSAMPPRDVPSPAEIDPLEVEDEEDDDEETITKFDKIYRASQKARKREEAYYQQNKAVFREAIGLDPEGEEEEEEEEGEERRKEGPEIIRLADREIRKEILDDDSGGDFFTEVDAAVASLKLREKASKQGKNVNKKIIEGEAIGIRTTKIDEEDGEEEEEDVEDVEEIEGIEDVVGEEEEEEVEGEEEEVEEEEEEEDDDDDDDDILADPSFDLDFTLDEDIEQITEPTFCMSLSELLDEARVVPILVNGDQDVEITGIQYDSRQVTPGNMFVFCPGLSRDVQFTLAEASEKGAVVIVANIEVSVQESVKAVVVVDDTLSILSSLSASFYGNPSRKMSVVGIGGSDGKTTTSFLLKSMYEAMERKTGLLGSISNYIHGKKKLETLDMSLDSVSLQKLMATMVHNGTDVCVMEVSADNSCKELDFDIAVFTNLTINDSDSGNLHEIVKNSVSQLFAKMTDPESHAKVVNIDDKNADSFIAQGNPDVPIITYSMENREADVFTLELQLSLFETDMLIHTPRGNVEISSGLLGRDNVYSILASVAVGIAINAPLEAIVEGIEEVDAVPGRCELIDEEQDFAVIVDHARSPDGLSRLLDTVRECGARRLITVVGCEGDCERGKRPLMAKIATDKSEITLLTSDNPRKEDPLYILDDMLAGVGWSMKEYLEHGDRDYYPPLRNGHRVFVYDARGIAVRAAVAMGEEGDAVIIAGKGHETYQIIGDKKEYLDDREECREALQHVDALHAAGIDTSEFPWRLPESH